MFSDDSFWKISISHQLEIKKEKVSSFEKILSSNYSLRTKLQTLERYNKSLEKQVKQLKKNNSTDTSGNSDLSARLQRLQEELTSSYKRNSEDATAMLSLTNQVQSLQKQLLRKDEEIASKQIDIERLQQLCTMRQNEAKANDGKYQTIKKELDAVQQAFNKIDKEKKALDKDYQALLNRWIAKAEEEANTMNLANELYSDMVSLKRQDQLLRKGALEGLKVDPKLKYTGIPITALPSTAKKTWSGHKGEINYSIFSTSGNIFATGGSDRYIALWNASSYAKLGVLTGAGQSIMSISFSAADEHILGASNDNTIRLWKVSTQREQCTLTSHIGKVYTAEFTKDGERVISGSHDRTLKIWDISRGGKCLKTIFCSSSCNDLCLPLEGSMICSVHLDSNIRLWDSRSASCVEVLESIHSKQVTSVSVSPDGNTVLTCARDNTLKLVDLKMNQAIQTFQHPTFRTETNWNRACLSPDGTIVVAGSANGYVYIWDALNGELKKILEGKHQRAINCVSWSILGQLSSCDRSGVITIWK